ncbi:MAG: hypothetical protein Q7K57_12135 [Burkholderiaceae bacterium]|nr:hypothetical protein [Burkholderiaceae bacterium]
MKKALALLVTLFLSACGTYNAADTLAFRDDKTTDMARCGAGLGIDNKVGLVIKSEAEKFGGELSAQQSSEIRIKAASEGLMTGDEKKYEAYLRCILELDKRRTDKKTSELLEKIHQPALKVYLEPAKANASDRWNRRLIVENTGEELTELDVTPAPFLFLADLCMIRSQSSCQPAELNAMHMVYIPIVDYYSNFTELGSYKGELYSRHEAHSASIQEVARDFTKRLGPQRTGSMNNYVITLVRIKYKDKFQIERERYIDVSIEQKELPLDLGQRIFKLRKNWIDSSLMIRARNTSYSALSELWQKVSHPASALATPWKIYRGIDIGGLHN